MERTSFTTNRSWILGIFTLVLGLAGFQSANAQCPLPTGLTAVNIGQNSATLRWTSNSTPTDNCWTVTVGGQGLTDCNNPGQATIQTTVCYINNVVSFSAPVTGMTVVGSQINVTVGGLQPGTDYEYYVSETCDGIGAPLNVSACAGPAAFITLDAQYTVTSTTVRPSCPFISPGYVANGSFTVTVTDGTTCAGTYTVNAAPVAASGPAGSTPPTTTVMTYIGFPQGGYLFENAGAGCYTVTVTETGPCNPGVDPVVTVVCVPDGIDNVVPVYTITDVLGNILADNDPATAAGTSRNFGQVAVPEGECGRQDEYYVYGFDNCDGFITAVNAVTATATTTPGTIVPGTQVSATPDGFGFNLIDVHWSTGTSTVTVTGRDAAGNSVNLTLQMEVLDNVAPVVTVSGSSQVTIPVCATSAVVSYTVTVNDGCQEDVTIGMLTATGGATVAGVAQAVGATERSYNVTFPAAGNYTLSYTHTDATGNVGSGSLNVTVQQAAANQPATIQANAETVTLTSCQTSAQIVYSFTISDDCEPINIANVQFNGGGSGLPNLNGSGFFFTDPVGPNTVYFEVRGNVGPADEYFPSISYNGVTASPTITVLQNANQPADIVLPAINVTIPQCATSVDVIIPITITDDCDNPIAPARASFTLGGAAITPDFVGLDAVNQPTGYFEFARTLTAANSGNLLVATYTDAQGAVRTVNALITVNGQPDTWAPIIVYPAQDIIVNLGACEASSATVVFEATATDNCGVADFSASFAPGVTGASILASAGGSRIAVITTPGTYTVLLTATDVNGNVRQEDFRIIVTQPARPVDNLACINNFNVTLNANCQATLAPEMVLTGNMGCLTPADFEIVVVDGNVNNGPIVDGCGEFIYEIRRALPAPIQGFNGAFAPANWTTTPTADGASVSFTPTVMTLVTGGSGPADGNDPNLAEVDAAAAIAMPCAGNLTFNYAWTNPDLNFDWFIVAVNGAIIAQGTANTSGTFNRNMNAGDVLIVAIDDDGALPGGQNLTISNFVFTGAASCSEGNFTTCWGNVRAEDKTKPTITCPANTDQATVNNDVQSFIGSLAANDQSINVTNYSCFLEGANPPAGIHRYKLQQFTVTTTDVYTFVLSTSWFDGLAALYEGNFDPNNPCQNMIAKADDSDAFPFFVTNPSFIFGAFDPVLRLGLPLEAGKTYTLLTTSWTANQTGDYTWTVFSDGNGAIDTNPAQAGAQPAAVSTPITYDLVCDDIDRIVLSAPVHYFTDRNGNPLPANQQPAGFNELWTRLGYTGRPTVADNCGQLKVTVSDVVQTNGNCGTQVITRTFRVEDKQNSPCLGTPNFASCTQTITVRKATLADDVVLPPFTQNLECDHNFPTLANGNPSPAVTGYPFVLTAFGIKDINQTYCNLAAQFQDDPRIVVCEGSYKFLRRWTILDWCNPGSSLFANQLIKVGDYTAPVVTCPVILDAWGVAQNPPTYSTTPFSCTASFAVPMPTVTDACSQSWTVLSEIVTDVTVPVLNQYGQQVGTTTQTVVVKTILPGANRNVTGIPVGNHRFRYTVTDNCGNVTTIECPFRVLDQIEPNAVCDDQLNISIGGQGFSRVYASDINEGSNDNCGPVTIEVRRAVGCASIAAPFTPWADYIDFSCCDAVGSNGRVRIELRVTDGSGNQNICWLDVLVEDKIRPFCYAPHNTSINCDNLPYDFNPRDTVQLALLFNGTNPPSATDNCTAYVRELAPTVNLHDCGWGTIVRNFQAVDQAGNTSTNACRQTITINENHNYWIKFPRDYSANCGDPNEGGIEYEEIGCDLLAVSSVDEPFSASGDECYKIFRTFRVINWCEYNGQDAPVIVGRDEDCDNVPGYAVKNLATGQLVTSPRFPNNGIYVIVRGTTGAAKTSWYDSNTNPSDNMPAAFQKGTSCDGLTNPAGHWVNSNQKPAIRSNGFWQYTQHIIVYDNVDPTITVAPFDPFCSYDSPTAADPICEGPVTINFSVNELCTPDDVTVKVFLDAFRDGTFPFDYNVRLNPNGTTSGNTNVFQVSGSYPNYTITAGALPIGLHRFEVHAEDGCGNAHSVLVNFEVRDCKAPTPICYNGLTVTLMPIDTDNDGAPDAGMAEIWASDFIASPVVDCTPPVRYSIRRPGQAPDQSRLGVAFDCSDYDAADGSVGTSHVIFIDAWDGAGNRDFCETYVLVQDQTGICAGPTTTGSVAGTISTETNEAVEGVDVAVSGPMSQNTLTNVSGSYLLNNLTAGGDYTVTPVLDANYLNGVSTFDLVLISRHILGVQLLDSPYKMVAADVNNSRSITTLDLIQLRRLILAIDTEFANNTSWRFVPASYSFPVPTNPWFEQFPEVININDLAGNMINQNFLAVKIGDVNGSVVPNLTSVEDRTVNGEFALNVMDQQVKAGNEYVVTFTGEQMESIRGYQATLTFGDALELVDVVYGAAKEENFGMRFVGEGAITMSWNGEAKSSDNLFSLVFRANAEGRLSEMLGVSSRYTRTEAYNVNNNLMGVSLNFGGALVSEGFELYQNQPNPFKGQTVIGYNLPEAAYVTLTVQDAAGKVLRVVRNEGVKGYNQVALNSNELPASGVLYYTIATEGFTATKKMIVVQ